MVWTVQDWLGKRKEVQQILNLFTKTYVDLPESSHQSTMRISTPEFYLLAAHDDLEDRSSAGITPVGPF